MPASRASVAYYRAALDELPPGSAVLDHGCGEGANAAIDAARRGHQVTAIDISPVAIEHARQDARDAGADDSIAFHVMNAVALELEPATCDFVCGLGVIHHLDIEASLREVARVMKPSAGGIVRRAAGAQPRGQSLSSANPGSAGPGPESTPLRARP